MDPTRNLIAAASRLGIRITPVYDAEARTATVTSADAVTLTGSARRLLFGSIETNRVSRILGGGRFDVTLDERAIADLTRALLGLGREFDRDKRIRRGQGVGPMSGSETVKFWRGRHGI